MTKPEDDIEQLKAEIAEFRKMLSGLKLDRALDQQQLRLMWKGFWGLISTVALYGLYNVLNILKIGGGS